MKGQNQKVRELVGAIVLTTQDVEQKLKFVTPFISSGNTTMDDMLAHMDKIQKQTFGYLVGRFLENSKSETDDFEEHCKNLIGIRNGVVHHFSEIYGAEIKAGKSESVIVTLQRHLTNITYFRDSLAQLAAEILDSLCNITFRNSPDLKHFEELRKELELSVAAKK
ncbi:MAG: hypothetical protein COB36_09940 [Alphaproteobacteria bacterium]|nr:MAG: hypothetical protein COB36_09940 [Alphaproteobacteria bacterium]